ncbi:MAG: choice-of-anchor J domain-containing protein, partial [Candidatus Cloacimonadaceae bacterium]|nr:choice-of-anchor J domain-containing protein [Candidatus Cloacimonadaceae bacterium]
GYPAGADNGPAVNGFGNMMFFNNQWSTLNVIAPGLDYNWNIHGYTANVAGRENTPIVHSVLSDREEVIFEKQDSVFSLYRSNAVSRTSQPGRDLEVTGFRTYRNGVMISEIAANQTTYTDAGLEPGLYQYYVTSLYGAQESVPSNIVLVSSQLDVLFNDNFSSYPDFALQFSPWTLLDIDQSITQGFDDFSFANWGSPMAFMIFNPSTTIPPMTTNTPYSGSKMAASFTAITPPNNDWMITPRVNLGSESAIRFYAKSHSSQNGLERMRVGVSTLANPTPESFQYLTGPTYVEVPTNWTEYMFDLTAYDGMNVWIGIQNVSSGALVMYIDEVS